MALYGCSFSFAWIWRAHDCSLSGKSHATGQPICRAMVMSPACVGVSKPSSILPIGRCVSVASALLVIQARLRSALMRSPMARNVAEMKISDMECLAFYLNRLYCLPQFMMRMQAQLPILKGYPVVHNWLAIPLPQDVTREYATRYIGVHGAGWDTNGCAFGVWRGRHACFLARRCIGSRTLASRLAGAG